jgi:hypothetical protein
MRTMRWMGLVLALGVVGAGGAVGGAGCGDDDTGSSDAASWLDGGPTDGASDVDSGGQPDAGATPDAGGQSDAAVQPGACGDIVTFADGLTPTAELHVATGGSDSGGDGSAGSPFATLEHAAGLATPGTAVVVHAGTYAGDSYVADLAGSAAAPIWIGGAAGEARPVISGGGNALHLVRARYVIVHDLEITGQTANGINCDDGGDYANELATHDVLFRNLYIHAVGAGGNQDCLKLSGLNDYFVLDSEFTLCGGGGSGSGVDHVGCHRGLIARNHFHDLSGNAVQNKGGAEDIEIRWNRIINAGERGLNMGGSTGFDFFRPPVPDMTQPFEARDIRAVANVFEGSVTPLAFVGCVECLAANNTIVNPTHWLLRILQETTDLTGYTFLPASDCTFINNLVYFDRSDLSTYINIGANTAPDTFHFTTNLWYAHDNPSASEPTNLPVVETGGLYGQDPAFTSGWQINSASPAAGAGTPVTSVVGDMNGACYASPPSIGAYEIPQGP